MSTWQERLARLSGERHDAERARANPHHVLRETEPSLHEGHHTHVEGNGFVCSCGQFWGIFSFVPDPRLWSDDPGEPEAARREHQEYVDSISCSVCGKRGVVAEQDWGAAAR